MKTAFIIHGAYSNPNSNWQPWLKSELENLDYKVIVPKFPTPKNQTLQSWNKVFEPYLAEIDAETIFIGHSLGCPFILNILQNINVQLHGIYLVAGFHTLLNHPIDKINNSFVEQNFNWKKIKQNSKNIFMFSGDSDPYINIEISNDLANKLNAEHVIIKNGGHLNETAGYSKFEELLFTII